MEYVIIYDWLYPYMSLADRKSYVDTLNIWGDYVLKGIRLNDSDQVTGCYFGLVLASLATQGDNPRAGEFMNVTIAGPAWRSWPVA